MLTENSCNPRISGPCTQPNPGPSSLTILPLSTKAKTPQKSKIVPKITVNNLPRTQRPKIQPLAKKNLADSLDDDLGNILDIPIIFAKDGENFNNLERISPLPQAPTIEFIEKGFPKMAPTTTKVVLISNKQDKSSLGKIQQSLQSVVRPNVSSQILSQMILRPQNSSISLSRAAFPIPSGPRMAQPTIKYTKIILAKRNSMPGSVQRDSEPVILTKNPPKVAAPKLFGVVPRILATYQDAFIEDPSKSVKQKIAGIPQIDLTSPKKFEDGQTQIVKEPQP